MKLVGSHRSTYHTFFSNLANPLKIKIILCLKEGEKNVSGIMQCLGTEQSKVSHALSNLKACSIVNVKREGKQRIYSLNEHTIIPILAIIDKHAKTFCNHNCMSCKKHNGKL